MPKGKEKSAFPKIYLLPSTKSENIEPNLLKNRVWQNCPQNNRVAGERRSRER